MTHEELVAVGKKLSTEQKSQLEEIWNFFAGEDDIPEEANKGLEIIAILANISTLRSVS